MSPRPSRATRSRRSRFTRATRPAARGRVVLVPFESRLLRRNPLGDPHVRTVPLYLPAAYDDPTRARERFPSAYMLTGFTGKGTMMLNESAWGETLPSRMDRLIASGRVKPMIVVMPDCITRYGGSQYLDSSAHGPYESHLIEELIPFVDRNFRTLRRARHRAVLGKSSGGFGAIVLGLRHPNVFGALADHSGDAAFEYCYLPDFPAVVRAISKHGTLAKWYAVFRNAPKKTYDLIKIMNIVAMAASYSPNPRKPLRIDLPFDEYSGALIPEVWRRWLAWDPVRMLAGSARYRAAARRMSLVFVDCGIKDEWALDLGARMLVRELEKAGARVIHEEFDDGHLDIQYRYDRSFAELSKVL
ncbi:MAG: alpha/beta hydrolase [Candidatus Eiseniibacteriota bacterium]